MSGFPVVTAAPSTLCTPASSQHALPLTYPRKMTSRHLHTTCAAPPSLQLPPLVLFVLLPEACPPWLVATVRILIVVLRLYLPLVGSIGAGASSDGRGISGRLVRTLVFLHHCFTAAEP